MITIGVEGKPGSGKTTMSTYLGSLSPKIAYIGVSKIVDDKGLTRFRDFALACGNAVLNRTIAKRQKRYSRKINGEEDRLANKIKTPAIFKLAIKAYFGKVEKEINRQLAECEKRGVEVAIVDYALLNVTNKWKDFDYRVWVHRDEAARREALKSRDNRDDENVSLVSSFAEFDVVKYGDGDVIEIRNDGSIDDLKRKGIEMLRGVVKTRNKEQAVNVEKEQDR